MLVIKVGLAHHKMVQELVIDISKWTQISILHVIIVLLIFGLRQMNMKKIISLHNLEIIIIPLVLLISVQFEHILNGCRNIILMEYFYNDLDLILGIEIHLLLKLRRKFLKMLWIPLNKLENIGLWCMISQDFNLDK